MHTISSDYTKAADREQCISCFKSPHNCSHDEILAMEKDDSGGSCLSQAIEMLPWAFSSYHRPGCHLKVAPELSALLNASSKCVCAADDSWQAKGSICRHRRENLTTNTPHSLKFGGRQMSTFHWKPPALLNLSRRFISQCTSLSRETYSSHCFVSETCSDLQHTLLQLDIFLKRMGNVWPWGSKVWDQFCLLSCLMYFSSLQIKLLIQDFHYGFRVFVAFKCCFQFTCFI